jgi:hypothetical protein
LIEDAETAYKEPNKKHSLLVESMELATTFYLGSGRSQVNKDRKAINNNTSKN